MELKLKKLEEYYTRAFDCIKGNDYKGATKILYNEMSFDLYDLSVDILFNSNEEYTDQKLRQLITDVDNALVKFSKKSMNFTSQELEDNFFSDVVYF